MATAAVGQLVMLKSPGPTNIPPIVGRVMVVALNANIIWLLAPSGGPFMNSPVNGAITLTDAQLLDALDANVESVNPPGSLGTLDWFGAAGPVTGLVLGAWEVEIPAAAVSPFDGSTNAAVRLQKILYVEVCEICGGAPKIAVSGERFTIIAATATGAEAPFVATPGVWTRTAQGKAIGWATT